MTTVRDIQRLWEDGYLPAEIAEQQRLSTDDVETCLRNLGVPEVDPPRDLVKPSGRSPRVA